MNKYLNAINEISAALSYSNYGDEDLLAIDLYTIRELVDKATPKKPLEIIFNNFGMGERIGKCPNCKILVNQFQSHCECDQKLDWSKDEK